METEKGRAEQLTRALNCSGAVVLSWPWSWVQDTIFTLSIEVNKIDIQVNEMKTLKTERDKEEESLSELFNVVVL